jgi:uncharacterized protein (TIGR02147 family)
VKLFQTSDYKEFLRFKLEENRERRGYKSELAQAAGFQRSFLSQVVGTHVHCTPDHAAALARFWGLPEEERDYFLELVHLARAGTEGLRAIHEKRIREIRARNENLASRFRKETPLVEADQALYYSSWHWSAIHILLSIPSFRTAQAIAARLRLEKGFVESCLDSLRRLGLVEQDGKSWRISAKDIHLPKNSPLTSMNHLNWRVQAVASSQARRDEALHYTAVHSLSRADFERIKQMILELLDRSRAIVGPSQEEELACLTVDWFLP